jgi:hypothetical protein
MTLPLRAAFFCGGAPLVLGTTVFVTWLATGWGWWERAWLWTILAGLGFFVAGVIGVVRHFRQAPNSSWKHPVLAMALLLLNFPIGALYVWMVIDIAQRYTLTVQNHSRETIDSLVVTGGGIQPVELGPIPTGTERQKRLHFTQDGKVEFRARQGAQEHRGMLEGSAGPGSGGQRTVRVSADGTWELWSAPARP